MISNKYVVKVNNCPLCKSESFVHLYYADGEFTDETIGRNSEIVKCQSCGLVYSREHLNEEGAGLYWSKYLSRVQNDDKDKVAQRKEMYRLEYEYISQFLENGSKVLDVGCGDGSFLEYFSQNYRCSGVELGHEAALEAGKKFDIYEGEFPNLNIIDKFDLIIFRGSIQYLNNPCDYFKKANSLLNKGGYIFITSTPNMNCFCHKLFGNRFTLPMSAVACCGYSPQVLDSYWISKSYKKWGGRFFYEETPYANIEKDIEIVYKAIENKKSGKEISTKSPAFWGNMMSLIYKKS